MPFQEITVSFPWKYRYVLLFLCLVIAAGVATPLSTLRAPNSLDM